MTLKIQVQRQLLILFIRNSYLTSVVKYKKTKGYKYVVEFVMKCVSIINFILTTIFPIGIEIIHLSHSLFYDSTRITLLSVHLTEILLSIVVKVTKCSGICYNMHFHYLLPLEEK